MHLPLTPCFSQKKVSYKTPQFKCSQISTRTVDVGIEIATTTVCCLFFLLYCSCDNFETAGERREEGKECSLLLENRADRCDI